MQDFLLRELHNINNEDELKKIGFDNSYCFRASEKLDYKLIKISLLTPAQANILKQTAISAGADCMTHREVITGKAKQSSAILAGNVSELKKIAQKLLFQPFGLKSLSQKILDFCELRRTGLTKIVGILNITDNSFSDGGDYLNIEDAKKHFIQLLEDGADMIDIGAESTKPYSSPVSANIQLERLLPVIEFIINGNYKIPVSIDTRSHEVAKEVLKRGDFIINDVSGFDYDAKMAETIAEYKAQVIIQHSYSSPDTMQNNPIYDDLMSDIYWNLFNKVKFAKSIGIERVIIDPGIGFGKTKDDNIEILARAEEFYSLGCPIMIGISRKSFLGVKDNDNNLKDIYTLAINSGLIAKNIDYIRVHNVKLHRQFMNNFSVKKALDDNNYS